MAFCTKCGSYVNGIASFCTKCGNKISAGGSSYPAGNNTGFRPPVERDAPTIKTPVTPAIKMPVTSPVTPSAKPPVQEDLPPQELFTTPAPKTTKSNRRITPGKELKLLLRQGLLILFGDIRNLLISLLFPVLAAVVTVWIGGENMFVTYEGTKSACFILVCAAIWCGLFNSIQSIVKERKNIKRDYVSGALRIECYMASRSIIQTVLCLIQSFVLTFSIPAINWVHGNPLPESGLFSDLVFLEFFISLFLIMLASDALGLLISCMVKKDELAGKLAPYILIAQLLFSGVLFPLGGAANILSAVMISRWGMEALGSICNLNAAQTSIYVQLSPQYPPEDCYCSQLDSIPDSALSQIEQTGFDLENCPCNMLGQLETWAPQDSFTASAEHLAAVIGIMALFVIVPLIVGDILLHRVKKDGRD